MRGREKNTPVEKARHEAEYTEKEEEFTGSTLLNAVERKTSCSYCRRDHASSKCDVISAEGDVTKQRTVLSMFAERPRASFLFFQNEMLQMSTKTPYLDL